MVFVNLPRSKPGACSKVLNAIYEGYRTYVESHSQKNTEEAVELIEQARQTHEQELITADQEYRDEFIIVCSCTC